MKNLNHPKPSPHTSEPPPCNCVCWAWADRHKGAWLFTRSVTSCGHVPDVVSDRWISVDDHRTRRRDAA